MTTTMHPTFQRVADVREVSDAIVAVLEGKAPPPDIAVIACIDAAVRVLKVAANQGQGQSAKLALETISSIALEMTERHVWTIRVRHPMPILTYRSGTTVTLSVDDLIEYEAKKAAQAREARQAESVQRTPTPAQANVTVEVSPAPDERWSRFCHFISGRGQTPQRKFLALVKGRAGSPITLEELARDMGVGSTSKVSGTFSGIRKNTRRAGFKPDDIITRADSGELRAGPILLQKEPPSP